MRPPRRINPYKLFYGSMIPNWLMRRTECTPGAKLMYARLCQYAGDDGHCFPSQDQLSQELGVSVRHVRRYLGELIRLKLIEKERSGVRKTNRYYFRMHPWIKAEISRPERADETPQIPKRTSTSGSKRTSTSGSKRTSTSGSKRTNSVIEGASTPRGTKPSGRLRESVVRESAEENHTTTTPTPPQHPARTETVGVVGQTVAIAQGEEAKATDGSMARAGVTAFDAFADAYPHHNGRKKAQAEWARQQLDATLPDILQALQWQRTLTGHDALPLYPHIYLQNKRWLDARPAVALARAWDEDAPRLCKEQPCAGAPGTLSNTRCDMHAMRILAQEASEAIEKLRQYDSEATIDVLEDAVWKLVDKYHINGDAYEVRMCIVDIYQAIGDKVTVDFLMEQIARVVRDYRAKPRLAVVN